jgi:hypothetical protein
MGYLYETCDKNIRFLPSIVAEKNATKNILEGRTDRQRQNSIPPPPSGSGCMIYALAPYFLSFFFWSLVYVDLIIHPLPEGGGGILFCLCLSVRPSKIFFVGLCHVFSPQKSHFLIFRRSANLIKTMLTYDTPATSHDMGYLYEACDQIPDFCHQ